MIPRKKHDKVGFYWLWGKWVMSLLVLVVLVLFGTSCAQPKVQRFGMVIGVKADKLAEYKELHAHPWPGVLKMIRECNIRNYSIYLKQLDDGKYYLFSYFEYVGDDFEKDMAKMAADPTTQKWWKRTDPCQIPLANRKSGEHWASMEEVFHLD